MSRLRTCVAPSGVAVVLLASPALALLAMMAGEALIDLAVEIGIPVVLSMVAAGTLGWALFSRISARGGGAPIGVGGGVRNARRYRSAGLRRSSGQFGLRESAR